MVWNWQHREWPDFRFQEASIAPYELRFLQETGEYKGALKYVECAEKEALIVDFIELESYKTSRIEGVLLNRDSLQSSIRRHFGLKTDNRKAAPAEQGIVDASVDLYRTFAEPLSEEKLLHWHRCIAGGRSDIEVAQYRRHEEPMQIVSGPVHHPLVHYEAPPSSAVPEEMRRFIHWFNHSEKVLQNTPSILTRAGIAHLYFESIHPFEDGNGRIGRLLSEKALSQGIGRPTLIALANEIDRHRKEYYRQLQAASSTLDITEWLVYFAETVIQAQTYSQHLLDLLIQKGSIFSRFEGQLNERQKKLLHRLFAAGPDGFVGGLSVANYLHLCKTSRATATRDLANLVALGLLSRSGVLKSTRYHLNLYPADSSPV